MKNYLAEIIATKGNFPNNPELPLLLFDIHFDMHYGKASEMKTVMENIRKTKLPEKDPIFGMEGPLLQMWKM